MIDSRQASDALADIDDIVQRVRQSQIYELAGLAAIWWGVLIFAGNVATWLWPGYGGYIWIAADLAGLIGMFAIDFHRSRAGGNTFGARFFIAFVLIYAFGVFCVEILGHFTPREQGAFWSIYFMLFYMIAGLWFGRTLVAIGLGISAFTLIGFFYIGEAFPLWMAFVNGGGLILGGLWMRRV